MCVCVCWQLYLLLTQTLKSLHVDRSTLLMAKSSLHSGFWRKPNSAMPRQREASAVGITPNSSRNWLQLGSPLTLGVSGICTPVKGSTHQHSPRWPWLDMLHWKEGRKTQTRQVGKHWSKRGRGEDAQWETRGVLMKHGVWWLKMCVCACVCVWSSGAGGPLDDSEGFGLGGTALTQ